MNHPETDRRFLTGQSSFVLGIDASRAVTDSPTGTEYYSRALTHALLNLDSDISFRLYTPTIPSAGAFPPTDNFQIRTISLPRLWTHVRLSGEMALHPPDALFVPAHVLPLVHPRNSLVTVHDLGYKYFPGAHSTLSRLYLDLSTRWNVRTARVVIADSIATRDDIVKYYSAPSGKIRVVYPGYNADLFRPAHDAAALASVRSKYTLSSPYLLSVGTLHPRKNYNRLIEAFAPFARDYSLVIVGKKGWRADEILARAGELGLENRVRFLDYVPLEELPILYGGAELAVLPSLFEGFGFPALEAQACGTPLVSSNASSLPEVAGQGAVYFDPQDIAAIRQTLASVLKDEQMRQGLIARGYENIRRFSWERAAREILAAATNS